MDKLIKVNFDASIEVEANEKINELVEVASTLLKETLKEVLEEK